MIVICLILPTIRVFAGVFVLVITMSTILDILVMWMENNTMFETKSTSANGSPRYIHKIGNEETPLLGSPTTNVAEINPKSGTATQSSLFLYIFEVLGKQ